MSLFADRNQCPNPALTLVASGGGVSPPVTAPARDACAQSLNGINRQGQRTYGDHNNEPPRQTHNIQHAPLPTPQTQLSSASSSSSQSSSMPGDRRAGQQYHSHHHQYPERSHVHHHGQDVKQEDGNGSGGAPAKVKRTRNRKPSSCMFVRRLLRPWLTGLCTAGVQCRKKKLRCNRASPCDQCTTRGEQCQWDE